MLRINYRRTFVAFGVFAAFTTAALLETVSGQQPLLTSRLLQDEVQELPADHAAFFSAARQVSIQLDLLADVEQGLDEALVSVVSLDGERRNFQPDENGRVTITEVEEGPHAIVASSKGAHGATVMYFEEQPEQPEEDAESSDPTKMTMVGIRPNDLRTFVDQISYLNGPADDVIRSVDIGPEFGYRIALQPGGVLNGRVYVLVEPGAEKGSQLITGAAVAGTRITILRGGATVGTAVADDTGAFQVSSLSAGVHGCVGVGPAGYAALAFEAVGATELVSRSNGQETLVSAMRPGAAPADELPVILIPPAMIPDVVEAIREYYPELWPVMDADAFLAGEPISTPFGGGFASSGAGYGTGGGGGGGSGGGGGGFGGIAAAIGLAAAASGGGGGGGVVLMPLPASPAAP